MPSNNSALDSLAAFAIAFIAGAVSAASFISYIAKVRNDSIVYRRADRQD